MRQGISDYSAGAGWLNDVAGITRSTEKMCRRGKRLCCSDELVLGSSETSTCGNRPPEPLQRLACSNLPVCTDALGLMIDAVCAAGADCGNPELLANAARIAVPQSLSSYGDPARAIAAAIGARGAVPVLAELGVLQQSLIGDACARIASGVIDCAIVVGGEARYRSLQVQLAGIDAPEALAEGKPDERWKPAVELRLEAEVKSGLGYMPVGYYAIVESAFRAAHGWSVAEHRDRLARMYERFSEIAGDARRRRCRRRRAARLGRWFSKPRHDAGRGADAEDGARGDVRALRDGCWPGASERRDVD